MKKLKFDGNRLRRERVAKGFETLESFAEALRKHEKKASKPLIRGWEQLGQEPMRRYMNAISEVLQRPIEFFFT